MWYHLLRCVPWLIDICGTTRMTHWYVWVWLINVCGTIMTHWYVWHEDDSLIYIFFIFFFCGTMSMTHWYIRHDVSIGVAWHLHTCSVTCSWVGHDLFMRWVSLIHMCVAGVIRMCCVTHSHMCVAGVIHMCGVTLSHGWLHSFMCVAWLFHMCGVTHSCTWRITPSERWGAGVEYHFQDF